MEGRQPSAGTSLATRLEAAKAGQLMRTRLSLAARKLKANGASLPFADSQAPPQLQASTTTSETNGGPSQPSDVALGKRKLVEENGSGSGGERGETGREGDESALGGEASMATTPKQNLYDMMLNPRSDHFILHDHSDPGLHHSSLGGLGYGFPTGSTSSGTNLTSNFSNYRGVSSAHQRQPLPPPHSSSPFDQPYDSHNPPMSPSIYLNSPDPGQYASGFIHSSHNPFPLKPRTPSSSTRDDTSKYYSSLFPTSSSSSLVYDQDQDPFIVSTGPRHLEAPLSPRRPPRIVPDAAPQNFVASSPRGIGIGAGGAFGRSPSATYASRPNAFGGSASFSFAQNHTTSPVVSPKMSSARTSMAPSRPLPFGSPSGPVYPSNLGMGGAAGSFPPRIAGASPGGGEPSHRGHRRTVSSTLSTVLNFQAARRSYNNPSHASPERKRRLPSGGQFSPSSSPDKKKRRSLSYGALPPPELPLKRKAGASKLGAIDVGLEESAASALASMLASGSSAYGSAGGVDSSDGGSLNGSTAAEVGGGGMGPVSAGRGRAAGTPPLPSGAEADANAAGMLIFLHHSPSPAKVKQSRMPGGETGTPGRGRILMFDDHPPPLASPSTLAPFHSHSSASSLALTQPSKLNLPQPPAFANATSPTHIGLVDFALPSLPPPHPPSHLESSPLKELLPVFSAPSSALSPPGPFFFPTQSNSVPSPLPLSGDLSQTSSLDDITRACSPGRKNEPDDIFGSQKDPNARSLPSPSPTLAPSALVQQGPTPSWPDFDFFTASSGDRTPTPPHLTPLASTSASSIGGMGV